MSNACYDMPGLGRRGKRALEREGAEAKKNAIAKTAVLAAQTPPQPLTMYDVLIDNIRPVTQDDVNAMRDALTKRAMADKPTAP